MRGDTVGTVVSLTAVGGASAAVIVRPSWSSVWWVLMHPNVITVFLALAGIVTCVGGMFVLRTLPGLGDERAGRHRRLASRHRRSHP